MATELTVQSERAYQKQPHIFQNTKTKAKSKKVGKGRRWYKEVGLGFRTPKTAIEGTFIGMYEHEREVGSGYSYLGVCRVLETIMFLKKRRRKKRIVLLLAVR